MRTRWVGALILVATLVASDASAECNDTAAACDLKAGTALLKSDPKEAAKKLRASYDADPQTSTLALYAHALNLDKRFVASAKVWRRVHTRLDSELVTARAKLRNTRLDGNQTSIDRVVASISSLERQLAVADRQIASLKQQTARVTLEFAGGAPPDGLQVSQPDEGEIKNPFDDKILVTPGKDVLIVTYPDGKTVTLDIAIAAGGEQTVIVPAQEVAIEKPAPPPRAVPEPESEEEESSPAARGHTKRWIGLGFLGGAAVSFGTALVFQLRSNTAWDEALANGCSDNGDCDARGAALAQTSQDRANIALGATIAGSAFVATGVVFLLLDRRDGKTSSSTARIDVVPRNGGGMAAVLTGRF